MILIPFSEMTPLADEIAAHLGAVSRPLDWHHFPDGESLVTIPNGLSGEDVAIVATLRDPDRLALPLRFAAATARELGARRVGLVAPYLGYMRQDRRFHPGQSVSAVLFSDFLSESFDWLVTVDPHLHRISRLGDMFGIPARRVATAPLLAEWIRDNVPDGALLGPDSESRQWVGEVARLADRPYEVLKKLRTGDREVDISVPESAALRHGTPVILDDIASSGRTMIRATERLLAAGAGRPICLIIHGIFAGNALEDLSSSGALRVVTTDTVPHPTNCIGVAPLIAGAIREITPQTMSGEGHRHISVRKGE
ncbi:ribose-phosphate diphosphokinase [Tranquillimonas alkanivorans]|uniref:Ribose-phosphate pyrophosphokinase n=1 Tax=Tranquillimonas alkanivorans TaxID=441119 RepID=A0A1I5WVJ5_9RHOB|nr:ribose-phosphate diphosphokinase [Tranquillimonas alkanivorans]SFQ23699.1 ribose-phosphate pyrophosphokinase [Tranquillimonas alkanivorans]